MTTMIGKLMRYAVIITLLTIVSCFPALGSTPAKPLAADLVKDGQAIDINSPRYASLFKELSERYGFSHTELLRLFYGVTIRKRVLELMDRQYEALPYYKYYPIFINDQVVAEGRQLMGRYKKLLDRVEKELGVERQIVMAIWGMESRYGQHQGGFEMFRTLNTMFDAYPRRRDFYRRQLINYLLLCRGNKVDPLTIKGSYGAAFGQTQFIPSSFREYAVDFDHDGRWDVWAYVPDVLASIANYLRRFDWTFRAPIYVDLGSELRAAPLVAAYKKGRKGLVSWQQVCDLQQVKIPKPPAGKKLTMVGLELSDKKLRYVAGYPNFQAITKWNNSNRYAMAVTELAEKLGLHDK